MAALFRPLPFLPILLLVLLESRLGRDWPAQDGSDKHRAALAFAWDIVPIEAKVAGNEHKGGIRYILLHPTRAKAVLHGNIWWRAPSPGRSPRARTIRSSVSRRLQWYNRNKILHTAASHYTTTLNRGGGTEEPRKGAIQRYILEGISLTEGMEVGWMDGLWRLSLLNPGDLRVLAMLHEQVEWIASVARRAIAK